MHRSLKMHPSPRNHDGSGYSLSPAGLSPSASVNEHAKQGDRVRLAITGLALVLIGLLADCSSARGDDRQALFCGESKTIVFVEHGDRRECLPFYVIGRLSAAGHAIVLIPGDITDSKVSQTIDMFEAFYAYITRAINVYSRERVPIVILSRPGLFGATGRYWNRHFESEYAIVLRAIEKLSVQLGITRLALVGHSGGSSAIMGALSLGKIESDCIVVGSGVYELAVTVKRYYAYDGTPLDEDGMKVWAEKLFSHQKAIGGIVNRPARRIFVVGDPRDTISPFSQQSRYAAALERAGHYIRLVDAVSSNNHDFVPETLMAAALCLKSEGDQSILSAFRSSPKK